MKTMKIMTAVLTPLVIFAVAFALVGCEDEPDSGNLNANVDTSALTSGSDLPGGLSIVPENPEITHIGQQIELEVFGGHWPYTWDTTDNDIGTAVQQQNGGADVRFTAVYTANEVAVNTITVTDASGRTGTAVVNAESASGPALAITPDTITLSTNAPSNPTFQLKAVGGTPPYSWHNPAPAALIDLIDPAPGVDDDEDLRNIDVTVSAGESFSVDIAVTDSAEQTVTCTVSAE